MPRYIALLRAINAGGRRIRMEVLRQAFEAIGFSGVTSYIASGNIIFTAPARPETVLENRIEAGLMQAFGYEITPFVRTSGEMAEIADFEPFPRSHINARDQLGILFLGSPVPTAAIRRIRSVQIGHDEWMAHNREIYWLRHQDAERQAHLAIPLEKIVVQPFTIRSSNTVQKLAERYCQESRA